MAQLKDPLREVNELLDRSPAEFARRMDAMAEAIVSRSQAAVDEAEESLAHLFADTMALADLFGRRRVLLEIDAKTRDDGISLRLSEPEFGFLYFASTPLVPHVPFYEAFDALLERQPRLAKNAKEIRKVYGAGGFALTNLPKRLSKEARLKLTARIQRKIASLGLAGAPVARAREVLAEIGGFSQSYAETIYRTNIAHAYSAGRFRQMEDPEVRDVAPAFMYEAVRDGDTRPNHKAAHGMIAPADSSVWDKFTPPIGFQCVVPGTVVSGAVQAALKSFYSGPVREIQTENGSRLSVTVNHPVLTSLGWRPAHLLREGDYLFNHDGKVESLPHGTGYRNLPSILVGRGAIDDQYVPSRIEDVFDAIRGYGARASRVWRSRGVSLDFHGDSRWMNGDIDVASTDILLSRDASHDGVEGVEEFPDMYAGSTPSMLPVHGLSSFGNFPHGMLSSGRGSPRALALALNENSVVRPTSVLTPLEPLRFGLASDVDISSDEEIRYRSAPEPKLIRELLDGFPGFVSPDKIIGIRDYDFTGHVYDLQTETGWMIANGIVISNCRCALRVMTKFELKERGLLTKGGQVKTYYPKSFGKAHPDPGFTPHRGARGIYG